MTRAILSVGALLAAAIALAGCGGSGNASGNASGTTAGVGGAHHHARGAANFRASVHGFEAQLQTSVQAFKSGNLSKAIASGGPLLSDCMGTVNGKIAPRASTAAQKRALAHLRVACHDMTQAVSAGSSGKTAKAKQLAQAALAEAHTAASLSG